LKVGKRKLQRFTDTEKLTVGRSIQLKPTMTVVVTEIDGDMVTVDANHPLAGASYLCTFTVLRIDPLPSSFEYQPDETPSSCPDFPYELASFSLGCFWGTQIAFDRLPGVIGTRVGYTQGVTKTKPTYDEVCQGLTKHTEAVLLVFDPSVVSYAELIHLALERLAVTTSSLELHRLFEPNHEQYRHGCFYHTPQQREAARRALEGNRYGMELLPASAFYDAEEEHQKYLYKGGQSQKKEAKDVIRCYG
jgi:peptide-methionine (S)-S-oxide reductase